MSIVHLQQITPADVAPPFGRYSHAILVHTPRPLLFTSGEVGVAPDGTMAEDIAAQCRQTWMNLAAILVAAGSHLGQTVQVRGYITDPLHLAAYTTAMEDALGNGRPASTLVTVLALAHPQFLVEIELVAALSHSILS